jgi:2-dehydro-3-deoxygalactonokinase
VSTALVGLDWGTSAARAYRIAAGGEVLDVRSASLGVQHVRDGGFADALATLLGDWRALDAPRLACGMIGSRQGWIEVPYCATPASVEALAQAITRVPRGGLAIIPGVVTREADGTPDVMRGEETQVLGALDAGTTHALVVLPGTHSKWVKVEAGAITGFTTYLTGELYAALLHHTILGRLAAPSTAFDEAAFLRGVARGLGGGMLAHDVFGARTLALFGELAPVGVCDWLSGLLIGAEVAAARAAHPGVDTVHVVGDADLAQRYVAALDAARWHARVPAPHAAARGLWQLARAAALA